MIERSAGHSSRHTTSRTQPEPLRKAPTATSHPHHGPDRSQMIRVSESAALGDNPPLSGDESSSDDDVDDGDAAMDTSEDEKEPTGMAKKLADEVSYHA